MTDRLRKLDALFAEHVMGYEIYHFDDGTGRVSVNIDGEWHCLPLYTYDLNLVADGAKKAGLCVSFYGGSCPDCDAFIEGAAKGKDEAHAHVLGNRDEFRLGLADSPAEAIVLACLRAVGVDEEDLR